MIVFPFSFMAGTGSGPPPPAADFLLNNYPYASGAFSLRKLDKNYTGSAIKVRQDSGSGTLLADIGFDSDGNLDTTSLLAHVGSANGFIDTWYDQSGLGNDFYQSVTASQPKIVNSGTIEVVNGKPAIHFDGSNDYMPLPNWNAMPTLTLFSLGMFNIGTQGLYATRSAGSSGEFFMVIQNTSSTSADGNVGSLREYFGDGNFVVRNRQDLYNAFATGNQSLAAISNLDFTAWAIGFRIQGYSTYYWDGYLQEVLMYDSTVAGSTDIPNFTAIQGAIGKQYKGWSDYSLFSTYFDGVDDVVTTGTLADYGITGDTFSISFWMKNEGTVSNYRMILGSTTNASWNNGFGVMYNTVANPDRLQFWVNNNWSNASQIATKDITATDINNWNHVVCTYDGTNTKIYVNGVKGTDGSLTGDVSPTTNPLMFGRAETATGSSYDFLGNLDEIAIWNTAISQSDVTTLYNSGVPNDITDLSPTAWWRMGDESGYQYLTNKMSYSKYSMNFDGINDRVDISSLASTLQSENTFSVSFWAKSSYHNLNPAFAASTGNDANKAFLIYPYDTNDGTHDCRVWYNGASIISTGNNSLTGWNHFCFVSNGATSHTVYINGSSAGTSSTSKTLDSGLDTCDIGGTAEFSQFFEGNIDDVSIFNSALSLSDVTDIYNDGKPKDESSRSNLVGYYKMGDNNIFPKIPNEIAYSKKSLLFDGADDYVDLGDSDSFSFGDGSTDTPFSISAWIYREGTLASHDAIVCKDATSNREWAFYIYSGKLSCVLFDNSAGYRGRKYNTAGIPINTWNHVVMTYNGNSSTTGIKLYLNDTQVDDQDVSSGAYTAMENTTAAARIGQKEIDPLYFDGKIDDVLITSTELSSSDITDIYNNGKPKDESERSGLVSYYKMGDGDYFPIATDSSGNGHNGTIYNETGAEMIQLDTPNGWGTAENETAPVMIQGDTPKGNHGYMENMEQASIKQDAPT